MPLPDHQAAALANAKVSDAPSHIIERARQEARKGATTLAIYFDSGADEKYANDLGYGYCPKDATEFFFHKLLGRVVAHIEPSGKITPVTP